MKKTLNKWQKDGLGALYEGGSRGSKTKWTKSDLEYREETLREEQRRYNSKQLAEKLERIRRVKLSADHLRQLLKNGATPRRRKTQAVRTRDDGKSQGKADVELEWQHLKEDELAGQMFESERELACHVIWGLESRGERAGHQVEFINLKST